MSEVGQNVRWICADMAEGDCTRGLVGTKIFLAEVSGVGRDAPPGALAAANDAGLGKPLLARNVGERTSLRDEGEALVVLLTMTLLLLLLAARVLAARRAPKDLRLFRADRGEQIESTSRSVSSGPDMGESGTESSEEQMDVPGEFCPLEV